MKIAYLIFAYKNPKLIGKTIESLSCEDSSFFIHIDKNINIDIFSFIHGDNIFYCDDRIPVNWGEFSGVKAISLLIQMALNSEIIYDYFVLLSGSEYPLKCKEYIHNYFEINKGREFINIVKMPNFKEGKPLSRINTFRINSDKPVFSVIVRILGKIGLAKRDYRKYFGALEPYSGNTWWALTREACQYILEFDKNNPGISKFFENTFAPEEMFFHTILGNSNFKERITRNVMYEDWSKRGGHPDILSEKHINMFEKTDNMIKNDTYGLGEMLFARKISDDTLDIVCKIDDLIKRREGLID